MAALKLTKNELRTQQSRLHLLFKYLPTLQLKKALLQIEVSQARNELEELNAEFQQMKNSIETSAAVLTDRLSFDIESSAKVKEVKKHYENIAGIEVPYFDEVVFEPFTYSLFDTPVWVDTVIMQLQRLVSAKVKMRVAEEKKEVLEKELRVVSIRVNLFEKILIPRAEENIKKIKILLGDRQLADVARAKVAKEKINRA